MGKFIKFCFLILAISMLCGCGNLQKGNSLQAFTHNVNTLGSYNMVNTGYIYNENEKSLYKFYSFNGLEFLLDFTVDKIGNLFCMNIIFDRLSEKHSQEMIFIKNCMYAFINDEKTVNDLIEKTNLFEKILQVSPKSTKEEIGGVELTLDTTEKGTFITVVKNNL